MHYEMRTTRASDLFWAWLVATAFSGFPSTLYALLSGGDALEATRAAASMLTSSDGSLYAVISVAALVHAAVSFFWAALLYLTLPRRHIFVAALIASAAIAIIDLRLIAPVYFPEVAALAFWPQLADHLMWGACFGITLLMREKLRRREA